MQRIRAWFYKQHAQSGVTLEQTCNQELIPPPYMIPALQRANDKIAIGLTHESFIFPDLK
jgi:hypothetical protein